eukprot:CAMPEP_0173162676 /NCGR_PEP_ID=MMETSP1105-20130129/19463_1 /TAXON_ID=2985 /ORGANISM="Ochromonas sp., Strain BG-1" /LENGTH=512 /DNA_ID=CAMNT_0014082579 /DNA_START=525 /DNA_END=2063 /DNA_ORIENTATION=+
MNLSFEEVLQEIQLMRLCNDANILTFHTNFVHKEELWLITQLMDKGSCLRVMTLSKALGLGEGFSEECLAFVLAETLKGLSYLHSRSLIHRDVKSGNILLDSRGGVKVSDLALSGTIAIEAGRQKAKTVVGTPCYMAPEVLEQQQNQGGYDHKADIWSLGITALELAKGYAPYAHLTAMKIMTLTLDSDPPSLKNYPYDKQQSPLGPPFSKNYEDFYKQCLQKHPKHRPSSAELLKHRLIRSATSCALIDFLQKIPNIDDVETVNSLLGQQSFNEGNPFSNSIQDLLQVDDVETVNSLLGQQSFNEGNPFSNSIQDLLQDFEDLDLIPATTSPQNAAKTINADGRDQNELAFSTYSSKSIDDGMKTPSRFHSHTQRSFDRFEDETFNRSRSFSNNQVHSPEANSGSDHLSNVTTEQNSEDNSAKYNPFPSPVDIRKEVGDQAEDLTPGSSSYVPGTTWVFDTSVRAEDGSFKPVQSTLEKKNEKISEPVDDIADFLDDFEEQEATIKTALDR